MSVIKSGNILRYNPTVFAVGENYQIFVPVKHKCFLWVTVDGVNYYDHDNGIMRTDTFVHRVEIPMEALDKARRYTVVTRRLVKRRAYRSISMEPIETSYAFCPLKQDRDIYVAHISDTHGKVDAAINCFKDRVVDLLVLNGDIIDSSERISNFNAIYKLSGTITYGEIPVIFSRGNHDLRGVSAEKLSQYTPVHNGNTYFTFRLGKVWGVVLDTGEDKHDLHIEYSGAVRCHPFRVKETQFLEEVAQKGEYEAEGIVHRLAISHNAFTHVYNEPFNIEKDIYSRWAQLLREKVKPTLMLCGHAHAAEIHKPGSEYDHLGQPCTLVIGSKPPKERDDPFTAAYVELRTDGTQKVFFLKGYS